MEELNGKLFRELSAKHHNKIEDRPFHLILIKSDSERRHEVRMLGSSVLIPARPS